MRNFILFCAAATALTVGRAAARDGEGAPASDPQAAAPVLIEMFVSQACKSCPPAAAYVTELARRPDVVALSWHIDYWNIIVGRAFGRWQDPFSRPAFTARQRQYNRNIRDRNTVFTPQAIVNGERSIIGSKRKAVEAAIEKERKAPAQTKISLTPDEDGYAIHIETTSQTVQEVYLVNFLQETATDVKGGDNAGMRILDAHVVTSITQLGEAREGGTAFRAPTPQEEMGCAVIVQAPDQGRVSAAQYCP